MGEDVARRLQEERERAQARLDHLRREREEIVATVQLDPPDDEHDPDGATLAWEREQLAALIAAQTERLGAIDDALDRVAAGTHGRCTDCGEPIPPARLEIRPAATRCVDCAD
jgi:RNA polymerase-binding transcription factor DksA